MSKSLEDFKDDVRLLFDCALLYLTADEYEDLCDFTKDEMIGC